MNLWDNSEHPDTTKVRGLGREIAAKDAELEQLRTDYQRICRGDAWLRQERDEARAEIDRLQNQLGQAHARIETDGREIEQLRAALKLARIAILRETSTDETVALDAIDQELGGEQEAGGTKP